MYRIQAINAAGTSDRSTRARAYTPAAPKPSPLLPAKTHRPELAKGHP